jgi:hypothetical protein
MRGRNTQATVFLATWVVACSAGSGNPMLSDTSSGGAFPGNGGDTSSGGEANGSGGSTASGGSSGGGNASGGSQSSGGSFSSGGQSSGGSFSSGGSQNSGGTSSSGGAASGGAASGGAASGGGPSSGGSVGSGGTTASCPGAPSSASSSQIAALDALNQVRLATGSGCANEVATLNTASQNHCNYYASNTGACIADAHAEVATCSGFTGASFGDRDTAAGYSNGFFEVMAFDDDPVRAVQILVDSVWHRTPLLSPWIADFGYGNATKCDTMDFGGNPSSMPSNTVVTYPYAGQTSVPTKFNGATEGPVPPAPPGGWPSGYPITVYAKGINITSHSITVDGQSSALPDQVINPAKYPNTGYLLINDAVIYANAPLTSGTTYRVKVSASSSSGNLNLEWTFTTK